ncbi:glutamate-5-semialdehyde dehydrogenase [Faecalispora anaeroviscerum]|uniref:glutamate-5-semialdehyde dehydrogenase n=1 Tax=Faecalispora anaeroviscerum TaxID=2991836 RepID=UPI0024BA5E7E|nr:glutamate-5-semialdehyde dehydrogenase [Faecalispora anaeroviscerum]
MTKLQEMGHKAKEAARVLANAGTKKDTALQSIADALVAHVERIINANQIDLEQARAGGMSESMLDRLTLNEARIKDMAQGALQVAAQTDPIGRILSGEVRPNGMKIEKVAVPLGVIGMIYEARPNVTADAAVLCLKAGNAIILRGGKEAIHSNTAIAEVMRDAVESAGLPRDSIQLIEDTSRQSSIELMGLTEYLDVLIPRGGAGLIRSVKENSHVPVIETGVGNCHVYVDDGADLEMAAKIIFNSKTSRPSVCNAAETLLVHSAVAERFLPIAKKMLDEKKVQLRADERALQNLEACNMVIPAVEDDWATEFSDYILAVRVVDSLDEAIEHISRYSSGHSEAIVTNNYEHARQFTSRVDAAAVYVNVSTRFTDGGQFGLGAEIGISTQKLHARGPMGVNELTSQKFIITGDGQIRE